MSCGGNMMRMSHQPLAHLVDGAAERWLAVAAASSAEQLIVRKEIIAAFPLGERAELTFHGLRYLLTIYSAAEHDNNDTSRSSQTDTIERRIKVHRIAIAG
jgi:hypothetical protein